MLAMLAEQVHCDVSGVSALGFRVGCSHAGAAHTALADAQATLDVLVSQVSCVWSLRQQGVEGAACAQGGRWLCWCGIWVLAVKFYMFITCVRLTVVPAIQLCSPAAAATLPSAAA
jgi:hypothetical protein